MPSGQEEIPESFYHRQYLGLTKERQKQIAAFKGIGNGNPIEIIVLKCIKIRKNGNAIAGRNKAGHGVVFFYMAGRLQVNLSLFEELIDHLV